MLQSMQENLTMTTFKAYSRYLLCLYSIVTNLLKMCYFWAFFTEIVKSLCPFFTKLNYFCSTGRPSLPFIEYAIVNELMKKGKYLLLANKGERFRNFVTITFTLVTDIRKTEIRKSKSVNINLSDCLLLQRVFKLAQLAWTVCVNENCWY